LADTIGSETGEVQWRSLHYNILFFLGILLFLVSFIINALTELFVKKYLSKKFQGA
jgi:phosphate transport system permease protein